MRISSVILTRRDGGTPYRHESKNTNGLFVEIKEGGIIISSRDESNGWYLIAFYTSDIITIVTPQYNSR
jgi:hypothetical protein